MHEFLRQASGLGEVLFDHLFGTRGIWVLGEEGQRNE
jgi:hypothetical protein